MKIPLKYCRCSYVESSISYNMAVNTSGIVEKFYFVWLKWEFSRIRLSRIDYCLHNLKNIMCMNANTIMLICLFVFVICSRNRTNEVQYVYAYLIYVLLFNYIYNRFLKSYREAIIMH